MYEFKEKNFKQLKELFEDEKVVVIPTDTIYGFSASIKNFYKIQELKKREALKPFLLLTGSIEEAQKIVDFSPLALKLANKGLTLVLPRKKGIFPDFFPKEKFLAVRIPSHKKLLNFLNNYWKKPLISTSVNISGGEILNSAEKIHAKFPLVEIFYEKRERKYSWKTSKWIYRTSFDFAICCIYIVGWLYGFEPNPKRGKSTDKSSRWCSNCTNARS